MTFSRIPFAVALLFAFSASAQLSQGGRPWEWDEPLLDRTAIPEVALHPVETDELPPPASDGILRYGVQRFLSVDVVAQAEWRQLPDGRQLGLITLRSPGAVMMSLQFDRWELPEGALVYLYNEDRTMFLGGFDQSNRGPDGTLATAVVPGEAVVIEYRLPNASGMGDVHIGSITHGLVDVFHFGEAGYLRDYYPGYESAPCQVNINCPAAAAWQDQKRSVVMFLRPDGHGCTGNLMNNTQTPGRPLVNMARHCYLATESQWVFYFNYEAPNCVGNQGPTNQTLTGATLRAQWTWDDLLLVELNNPVPLSYNPYFAGWDRSGNTPQSSVVIQHPLYDVKKIAFNNDPSTSAVDQYGVQMWRGNWDQGIVEAVASGSPLFDQNKRVVGHMYSGGQNCTNAATVHTDCAKLEASWDGTAPNTRLRDWLDPSNTVITLDGYDPGAVPMVRVRLRAFLEGPFNTTSTFMNGTLRDNGLVPLMEPYSAAGYAHSGGGGGESTTVGTLGVSGNDAVVDWVVIELRDKNAPANVLATRSALLKRNGYVVDTDGTSDVLFPTGPDQYFIALRHRNHLGIMTSAAQTLSSTASLINLSNGDVPLYGGAEAVNQLSGRQVLWSGDANGNGTLRFTGSSNDRDAILSRVGGISPTDVLAGYWPEDVNLDGVVRFTGTANDRDVVLQNIGGSVPTNLRPALLP